MNRFMCRRYLLFCVSLFVNALGIAFITKAALGTSPITSVTYVLSMFTPFTIGQWTIYPVESSFRDIGIVLNDT